MEYDNGILARLKFINLINVGEKIVNYDQTHMELLNDNYLTSIIRMFYKENRGTTISFFTTTYNRIFEILNLKLSTITIISSLTLCKNIIKDLIGSINGLENIKQTYCKDRLFCCYIDTLIQTINSKLDELRVTNPDLFLLSN